MFKGFQNLLRFSKSNAGAQGYLRFNNFASAPITAAARNLEADSGEISGDSKSSKVGNVNPFANAPKGYNSLVAAAFASLKDEVSGGSITTPFTDERIQKATTVGELLSISEGSGVSRRHALKVVSILADWSTSGKVNLSDFETDPRFIRLCKILTRGHSRNKNIGTVRSEDLSMIINVTADDEAAKLITSISLPQMVKVMLTLAHKKRRSTMLLRSLAFNIARSSDHLNLKQCSDILYSSAILNFVDENMLEKVCLDVCLSIRDGVKGSAAVGSVLTSLGFLRYKDTGTLDALSSWVLDNYEKCRPQDVISLFITLATLNHQPTNSEKLYETLIPLLNISEVSKPSVWLDVIWSLVVLNQAKAEHISSVLNEDFIKRFEGDAELTVSSKLKLLNINSACDLLMKEYQGAKLPADSSVRSVPVIRSKNKDALVVAIQDCISNLLNPKTHLRINVDTKMGFYIDAELILDKKGNPLPFESQEITDQTRVALMVHDYHDLCRGRLEPTGIYSLFMRLLEAQGYRILTVPYTDFNPRDKLVNRVKYLETQLKTVAS